MKVTVSGLIKPSPPAAPVYACRGCLDTEAALHELSDKDLVNAFSEFTGHYINPSDGYPQYICKLCLYLLRKFVKFRHRCIKAMYLLQQLEAEVGVITTASIKELDREKLRHNFVFTQIITLEISKAIDDVQMEPETLETPLQNTEEPLYDDLVKSNEEIFDELQDIPNNSDFDEDDISRQKSAKYDPDGILPNNDSSNFDEDDISRQKSVKYDPDGILANNDDSSNFDEYEISRQKSAKYDPDGIIPNNDSSNFDEDDISRQKSAKYDQDGILANNDDSSNFDEYEISRQKSAKYDPDGVYSDSEIDNLSESCKKRIEEIQRETLEGKCNSRRLKIYNMYVKKIMNEAVKYNLDVVFFTKEEQILELEKMRKSERFNAAKYKCEKCCAIYSTAETMNRHAVGHDPSNGPIECDVCEMRYRTRHLLNAHYLNRHTHRIVCKTCGRVVTMHFKTHYEWHQGKHELYKCDQCNKQFTLQKQYMAHVSMVHRGYLNGPECLICNDARGFSSEAGLSIHMFKVHKANPRCSSCKVVFADSDALTVHGNASGGCQTGYSSCQKCGENFTNETEMMKHFNKEHRFGWYKCKECPRHFQNLRQVNKHEKSHLNALLLNSNDEKITVDYERRIKTRKLNTGNSKKLKYNKTYRVCEVCGKMQNEYNYEIHMRTHTGEKPFQCDICQKKFNTKVLIQAHMVTHTGKKKYKCEICFKTFSQSTHLKCHKVIHSGEKPYECKLCLKRFGYKTYVREHVRTVHEGLPPSRKKRVRRRKENVAATQSIPSQMDDSEQSMCPEYLNEEMLD